MTQVTLRGVKKDKKYRVLASGPVNIGGARGHRTVIQRGSLVHEVRGLATKHSVHVLYAITNRDGFKIGRAKEFLQSLKVAAPK